MTGMDNVSKALALRIVIGAELKRLSGSRPKRDGEQVRGVLTAARRTWCLPRCTEASYPRLCNLWNVETGSALRGGARQKSPESPKRKRGERQSRYRTREEANARL
jgi:hypothetical protein